MPESKPPASLRSERALIGGVLVNNSLFPALTIRPSDFSRPSHAIIWEALAALHRAGQPLDLTLLTDMLDTSGDLDACGGAQAIAALTDGIQKSVNCEFYAARIQQLARRRDIQAWTARAATAAGNGVSDAELQALLADFPQAEPDTLIPLTFEDLHLPSIGNVDWLIEGLIPAGDITIVNASWKTAKTLCFYELVISALFGRPAWGRFQVKRPIKVQVWQLEMPSREDKRRLQRLMIGQGLDPRDLETARAAGNLIWFNRPLVDLLDPGDIARFHRAVLSQPADLVIVDSFVAAFSGEDVSGNSEMNRAITRAFTPLTVKGVAVACTHHKRKTQPGGPKDDPKSSMLGAQAIGAACGTVYSLERLPKLPQDAKGSFKLVLDLAGSWRPGESDSVILAVEDTPNGKGTTIQVLDETAQLSQGGVSKFQQAALNIRNRVIRVLKIPQPDALLECQSDLNIGARTAKAGLSIALSRKWITQEPQPGKNSPKILVPGLALHTHENSPE